VFNPRFGESRHYQVQHLATIPATIPGNEHIEGKLFGKEEVCGQRRFNKRGK